MVPAAALPPWPPSSSLGFFGLRPGRLQNLQQGGGGTPSAAVCGWSCSRTANPPEHAAVIRRPVHRQASKEVPAALAPRNLHGLQLEALEDLRGLLPVVLRMAQRNPPNFSGTVANWKRYG